MGWRARHEAMVFSSAMDEMERACAISRRKRTSMPSGRISTAMIMTILGIDQLVVVAALMAILQN